MERPVKEIQVRVFTGLTQIGSLDGYGSPLGAWNCMKSNTHGGAFAVNQFGDTFNYHPNRFTSFEDWFNHGR